MGSEYAGKRVLITGAAGFIGSHLVPRLVAEGAQVVGLDNYSFARPDRARDAPDFHALTVDLRRLEEVRSVMESNPPDFIFHLAAIANPRQCKQDFPLGFDVNVLGTQNLLRSAPAAARVVFMSSAAVYGEPVRLPIDETHPRLGSDPYSITKILGEELCLLYNRHFGRNIAIVRNFNSFGVGQVGDYIVPQLIRQGLAERKVEIWNSRTVRDFLYIDNAVDALLSIATHSENGPINIGSGRGVSIGELAQAIVQRFGGGMEVVDLQKKVLGSPALVSSNEKLRSLGWTERVSFEDGIGRTIRWTEELLAHPPAAPAAASAVSPGALESPASAARS